MGESTACCLALYPFSTFACAQWKALSVIVYTAAAVIRLQSHCGTEYRTAWHRLQCCSRNASKQGMVCVMRTWLIIQLYDTHMCLQCREKWVQEAWAVNSHWPRSSGRPSSRRSGSAHSAGGRSPPQPRPNAMPCLFERGQPRLCNA